MADWVLADQHPPSYGNFTDCCSDSSYFIPTLTAPHLADQVLADLLPLIRWQFHRFLLYPESSYLGRPSVGRSTPESYGNFTDCCSDSSYFSPTLRAQHLADQVLADLPPCQINFTDSWQFLFQILCSSFGRPCPDRASPIQWWFGRFLFQLSSLRAYNLAEVKADLTPHIKWQFTDPCEIHISFLLWELNIWLTRSWQI